MSILTSCVSTALLIIIITCLHKLNATALWETSINWEKAYRSTFAYLRVSPLSLHAHTTQNVPVHLCYLACMYVDMHRFCTHVYTLRATYQFSWIWHTGVRAFFPSSLFCKCCSIFLACCWNTCRHRLREDTSYALRLDIFRQMLANAVVEGSLWMQWAQ